MLKGLGTLGIKAIMVALDSAKISLVMKNSLMAWVTKGPVIFQDSLKKCALNPSGPGALLL